MPIPEKPGGHKKGGWKTHGSFLWINAGAVPDYLMLKHTFFWLYVVSCYELELW